VPEGAPPRLKYEKISLLMEISANYYIKFLERVRIEAEEIAPLPPERNIPIVEISSGKSIF